MNNPFSPQPAATEGQGLVADGSHETICVLH